VPVIWHLHDFVSVRPLMRRLLSHSIGRCSAIIANSQSVEEDIAATFGCRPPTETIYNGIDLIRFNPLGARLDLDKLAGLSPASADTVRIGLVATMARWKGHDVFLHALSMLGGRPVRGYVIGAPIYRTAGSQYSIEQLQEVSVKLGLDGRVGFTGFVHDTAAAMRSLDIIVHASVAPEPFGLAIAEAFASGRAVVAARAGGVGEIIHENHDGCTYKPGDAAELAALLTRLVLDPKLRCRLGSAARKTAEGSFTHRRLAADLMRVYGKLLRPPATTEPN
jgi:glycosyltransferase involved in cell wall biosynthesis